MEDIRDIFTLKDGERAYFKIETDKDPLSYSLGEDMNFKFTLCDLQAARFLMKYFGSEAGQDLWDGKTIGTRGGSQGAFQATAVGALLPVAFGIEPSFLIYNMPWMCDIGGVRFAHRYKSGFLPLEAAGICRYFKAETVKSTENAPLRRVQVCWVWLDTKVLCR